MKKRIKCIRADRPDLGPRITDGFIRKDRFYDVVRSRVPGPLSDTDDWIEIFDPHTNETYTRPRYMFGPELG